MALMAHRVCLAMLMVAPLLASGRTPSDVASAVCEQDDPQLTLMQLQAKPKHQQKHQHAAVELTEKSQRKHETHGPKRQHEHSTHESKHEHEQLQNKNATEQIQQRDALHEQKLRQAALLKEYKKIHMPTMEEVQDALDTLVDSLEDIGENMNSTVMAALTAGEGSIKHVVDFLEVAETSAETAAGILGTTASNIVVRLTALSNEIQVKLEKLAGQSESLRVQITDTLNQIYDVVMGQGNTTAAKMETADADAEAAGNTTSSGNSSLLQVKATVEGLRKAVQAGCLTQPETHALLEIHGRSALASHFQEVDSNGDGCIRADELERSLQSQSERPFLVTGDAVALLAFRAVAGHHLSSSASLEEAVARKGASTDPCSVATSALASANSSLTSLEGKLNAINETMVDLMEQTLDLLESTLEVVNTTVVSGIEAAIDAGLPRGMAHPVQDALSAMMSGYDTVASSVTDSEASIADAIVKAVNHFTPVFVSYIDGISSKIDLVCA